MRLTPSQLRYKRDCLCSSLQGLICKPDSHVAQIEDRVLGFQSSVPNNGEVDVSLRLQPAIAQSIVDVPIIHIPARNDAFVQTDPKYKIRQGGGAGKQYRSPFIIVVRARNLIPVGIDDVV